MSDEHVAPASSESVVAFPVLQRGPAVFYETDRHEVWVGLPLRQMVPTVEGPVEVNVDAFSLAIHLDRAKYDTLIHLAADQKDLHEKRQRQQTFERTGLFTKIGNGLKQAASGLVLAGQQAVGINR